MSQKVQFIATVMHSPELIILDEPFSGLDPISAGEMEAEIKSLAASGSTILFSTHRLEQVEEFCKKYGLTIHSVTNDGIRSFAIQNTKKYKGVGGLKYTFLCVFWNPHRFSLKKIRTQNATW